MGSPADKVQQGLLKHVHLLSAKQYPHTPNALTLDQALEALINAPRIVSSSKPVSWQYISPPADGTIFLAWQPTAQQGPLYASDGYIFPEQESCLHHNHRGYTIEIFLAESGFIPQQESVATHRRARYRLIAASNGQGVDSSLEIVHYTQAPQAKHLPSNRVHLDPAKLSMIQGRAYLEEQGQLTRKEFMLYDSHNWPVLSMPGRQAPGASQNPYQRPGMPNVPAGFPPGMARPQGPPQPFQAPGMRPPGMGPSPAKRQKMMPSQPGGMRMPDLGPMEEEENSYIGDLLDLLTPREISVTRYKQHHEWMEEILSSAYPVNRIVPADMNFQLAGELSELTKDLFAEEKQEEGPRQIKQEDVQEFEKRVSAYQAKGEDEIAQMKAQHKAKIEELSRQQVWTQLEDRLSKAVKGNSAESVDDIMREVEKEGGQRIGSREDVVRVQKGGMLGREETLAALRANQQRQQQQAAQQQSQQQQGDDMNGQMQGGQDDFGEFANLDTAGEALDFYSNDFTYGQ